jgi:hypothetical protein
MDKILTTAGTKVDISEISFGDRVAENEASQLASYFVKTDDWNLLRSGKIDIVFGTKGAGKSALYTLLTQVSNELEEEGIILASAEKPTGQTVFSEIKNEPPTSEAEFVGLWKVYICQLIIETLTNKNLCHGEAEEVRLSLVEAELIEEKNTLKRLVNSAMAFAKNLIRIESVEGGATMEGGVTGKLTFRTPDHAKKKMGFFSVDELLERLNDHLLATQTKIWLLFDRLDVAFDEDPSLEKNALRALFKTYRDIEDLEAISLKVFLRDDIWKKITDEGFRESSHITRTTLIKWSHQGLLNLIVSRILRNEDIITNYQISPKDVISDQQKQIDLYYLLFPNQVDVGEKQSQTFDWIINRVRDGLGNVAPREFIHFHNEIINNQKVANRIGGQKAEGNNIFSKQAIKDATLEVSKVRLEQNIFAEYASLKPFILRLEKSKAEQNLETLSALWGTQLEETKRITAELIAIGFFENRAAKDEGIYKVPFMYRPYLEITQGKAFSNQA